VAVDEHQRVNECPRSLSDVLSLFWTRRELLQNREVSCVPLTRVRSFSVEEHVCVTVLLAEASSPWAGVHCRLVAAREVQRRGGPASLEGGGGLRKLLMCTKVARGLRQGTIRPRPAGIRTARPAGACECSGKSANHRLRAVHRRPHAGSFSRGEEGASREEKKMPKSGENNRHSQSPGVLLCVAVERPHEPCPRAVGRRHVQTRADLGRVRVLGGGRGRLCQREKPSEYGAARHKTAAKIELAWPPRLGGTATPEKSLPRPSIPAARGTNGPRRGQRSPSLPIASCKMIFVWFRSIA
jgi:hypothetical protein